MFSKKYIVAFIILLLAFLFYKLFTNYNFNLGVKKENGRLVITHLTVGQPIDSLHGVMVYFNDGVANNSGRNLAIDNYNLGIKYQCVEFVKRYYYQHLKHKMPDAGGNAKDFFDKGVPDGQMNEKRNLLQFTNGSITRPQPDDLIIFDATILNPYGHVAIIDSVTNNRLEIIQQNPGPYAKSRIWLGLKIINGKWTVEYTRTLGWLRKQ